MIGRSPAGLSDLARGARSQEAQRPSIWPGLLLGVCLAALTTALLAQPYRDVLSHRTEWFAAVVTATFLIALLAGYAALTEFLLAGSLLSLAVGAGFTILALVDAVGGILPLISLGPGKTSGVAVTWAAGRAVSALVFALGAYFGSHVIHRRKRPLLFVLATGGPVAIAILLAVLSDVHFGSAAVSSGVLTRIFEAFAALMFVLTAVLLWSRHKTTHGESDLWLSAACLVAAAAQVQYAAHLYRPYTLQVADLLRLLWFGVVLTGVALEWIRAYRRLYRQSLELDAFHRIVSLPSRSDIASTADHIAFTAGQILRANARFLLPEDAHRIRETRADGEEGTVRLAVPVLTEGRGAGRLEVSRPADDPFTPTEVQLFGALGVQAGVLLERALLRDDAAAVAVHEERSRLAREIHDGLAQHLAFLKMRVAWLRRRTAAAESDQLQEVEQVLETALTEARQAITALRMEPGGQSVCQAVANYAREFGQVSGLAIDVREDDEFPSVSAPARAELVRIVQEALHNVRKHSQAKQVTVELSRLDGGGLVVVADNGMGFASGREREGHFGLEIMRERAESVGGRLEVESQAGQGTRVCIWMPPLRSEEGFQVSEQSSGMAS